MWWNDRTTSDSSMFFSSGCHWGESCRVAVIKNYPIIGHKRKLKDVIPEKFVKNGDAIWRILAKFRDCRVRLKLTFLC